MKGEKRFKIKGVGEEDGLTQELNIGTASEYFRKKMSQSSYCS
jgi:hypothetical protein